MYTSSHPTILIVKSAHFYLGLSLMIRVLISILNWNSSSRTQQCVQSIQNAKSRADVEIFIRIIDNASRTEQRQILESIQLDFGEIIYNPINTGFTGGQNSNIQYAIDHGFDYVWLLNNDTLVGKNALSQTVALMESDASCGAASPLIVRMGDPSLVDFCGGMIDWKRIDTVRPKGREDMEIFLITHAERITAVGTALMLRVAAVKQVGKLDDRLFAYYEDDDFGARLIENGWRTRIVTNAEIEHACFEGDMYQRPPYFFYLMTRNAFFFALRHAPATYRRALKLKFIDRSLVMAEKLLQQAQPEKADACLLGLADALRGRGGAPVLDRTVPLWVRCLQPVSRIWNRARLAR
jgi:GT2 family glycosyltransferase